MVIQVIYITCSWQVFVFPILQSPHNVALIFRTCQLHTAWELLHENGGSERQAARPGQLHWQGRLHPRRKRRRKKEDLLIQEYCIPAKMSKLCHPKCRKWPRAFPCKYLMLLSNLLKASSSTVSLALPAITKNPSPAPAPWLLQPQLPPRLPESWSPAAATTCCRVSSVTAARYTLSSTRIWSPSCTWAWVEVKHVQDFQFWYVAL